MAEVEDVVARHGYHPLRVKAVVEETDDTRSFVLDVPDELREHLPRTGPASSARSASASATTSTPAATRCRARPRPTATSPSRSSGCRAGSSRTGCNDHVARGRRPRGHPAVGHLLRRATTTARSSASAAGAGSRRCSRSPRACWPRSSRPVRLLYANRDEGSVIFAGVLAELEAAHPERLELRHHLDADAGFVERRHRRGCVGDAPRCRLLHLRARPRSWTSSSPRCSTWAWRRRRSSSSASPPAGRWRRGRPPGPTPPRRGGAGGCAR